MAKLVQKHWKEAEKGRLTMDVVFAIADDAIGLGAGGWLHEEAGRNRRTDIHQRGCLAEHRSSCNGFLWYRPGGVRRAHEAGREGPASSRQVCDGANIEAFRTRLGRRRYQGEKRGISMHLEHVARHQSRVSRWCISQSTAARLWSWPARP